MIAILIFATVCEFIGFLATLAGLKAIYDDNIWG